ncbi:Crp/Fnr family transcriptional regulator [Cerasicoccus maritimus]|uniref:Crp/Fnr family transcriptional regulator n=1 Tax=Cerasicoccus maritimus TaxID=490089 RepID=UPI0028527B7F|nr:Crp/Fnr family transcriptional regulator [Cerasicoccus maritimus]
MRFLEENLLEHLQRPEFAELYASLTKRSYAKGAFICQPGAGDNKVFIIAQGRARVYLGYEDKEFNLGILNKGDIYSTHTRAYVQSLEAVDVLAADVRTFRQKMLDDPEVTKSMVTVLGGMLAASFQIIEGLVFKDVNSRLATLLTSECKRNGVPDPAGGAIVQIDLSVEQIAGLLGSTRQTVSTLINDLSRQGLIQKLERGRFLVPDIAALDRIANPGDW